MKQADVQDNAAGKMVGGGGWKRREVLERANLEGGQTCHLCSSGRKTKYRLDLGERITMEVGCHCWTDNALSSLIYSCSYLVLIIRGV